MTIHYELHAKKVVNSFKSLLSEKTLGAISDEHFDELTMLIESAISTSVVEELEVAADQLSLAATKLRQHAERFDP